MDPVDGGASADRIRSLLNRGQGEKASWEVMQVGVGNFLAVGRSEEEVEAALMEGYMLAEETLLRLSRWSLSMGSFLDVRGCTVRLRLLGVPLVLCDELGTSHLLWCVGRVEKGSMAFVEGG